ncbi:MAG: hypothetical protein JWR19_1417 [Pedosphaera sp.]|nr:hypothetical protein [Pedosphaera sp.]
MTPWLEVIIPVANPGKELEVTAASLVAQTDRNFAVVLSDNYPSTGQQHLAAAQAQLTAANIPVRRVCPPLALGRIEHWNWAHAQAEADWIKPLFAGERLLPAYVGRLQKCVSQRPRAQFVRCDAEISSEWGRETLHAPFTQDLVSPAEFLNYFPAQSAWLGNLINVAYTRVAWRALGGYSVHLLAGAPLNLNVLMALHHGVVNMPECLAAFECPEPTSPLSGRAGRFSRSLEMWLILRQARNYCDSAKLTWPERGILPALWRQIVASAPKTPPLPLTI